MNLTVATYIDQTLKALTLFELMWGLSKSVVFAALISWVACLRGFQVRGGAAQVGNAATSAVVSGIFLIILFDSIFAVIRSYW
jgi:phospholipid/cholesterol/gamma-HCH transport system permease protein